jgi:CheY-like chemotaxis protein
MGTGIPADSGTARGPTPGNVVRVAPAGRRSILIVEDYTDLADVTAQLLQGQGHDVVTAYTGWSALKAVETFSPDVVLLDIALPDLDGYGVADRLRRHPHTCHAQLVAVTAGGEGVSRARFDRHGFTTHLLKPYDWDELLHTVDGCLSAVRLTEPADAVACRVPRSRLPHLTHHRARPAWPATKAWALASVLLRQRLGN